jgi:hypothetical protein
MITIIAFAVLALALVAALAHLDYVAVWLMRTFNIYVFPEAIRIAVSLERNTNEWTFGSNGIEHPRIRELRTGGRLYLLIDMRTGQRWDPNWIERRIILDAIEHVTARRAREHLERTLPG